MPQSRRQYLSGITASVVSAVTAGVSGCLSRSTNSREPGQVSLPNPVIESVEMLDVTIEGYSNDEDDVYTATVLNEGGAGDAILTLYWVDEDDDGDDNEPGEERLTEAVSERLVFDDDGEKTVSFTRQRPDEYSGFIFVISPVTVRISVVNNGARGDVTVSLSVDGETVDETTELFEQSESKMVLLEADQSVGNVPISVDARPSE